MVQFWRGPGPTTIHSQQPANSCVPPLNISIRQTMSSSSGLTWVGGVPPGDRHLEGRQAGLDRRGLEHVLTLQQGAGGAVLRGDLSLIRIFFEEILRNGSLQFI